MLRTAPLTRDFSGNIHKLLSACLSAGRYIEAFKLGEALLDCFGRMPMPQNLLWPWWYKVKDPTVSARFLQAELMRLERMAKSAGVYPHWFAYCRSVILIKQGHHKAALGNYSLIRQKNVLRYDFMRQPFVVLKLALEDDASDWVIHFAQSLLEREPGLWELRCRMAEAFLAQGNDHRGLVEFKRAARFAEASMRPAIWAWHGEALLWLGYYQAAMVKLDAAIAEGEPTYARVWRGAVYLKQGRVRDALREFKIAENFLTGDPEIPLWKGEAYRILGKFPQALDALRLAVNAGLHWGLYNRALVYHALRDTDALLADFSAIPMIEKNFLRIRLKLPQDRHLTTAEICLVLEAGLKCAKGVRRSECFLRHIWMRQVPI